MIIGARNETQLRDNLDAASAVTPAYPYYPYWREGGFKAVNPPPV